MGFMRHSCRFSLPLIPVSNGTPTMLTLLKTTSLNLHATCSLPSYSRYIRFLFHQPIFFITNQQTSTLALANFTCCSERKDLIAEPLTQFTSFFLFNDRSSNLPRKLLLLSVPMLF